MRSVVDKDGRWIPAAIDELYASYGKVIHEAQVFEDMLRNLLILSRHYSTPQLSVRDLSKFGKKDIATRTIGRLLKDFKDTRIEFDEGITNQLKNAANLRNMLVHKFFIRVSEAIIEFHRNGRTAFDPVLDELEESFRVIVQARGSIHGMVRNTQEALGWDDRRVLFVLSDQFSIDIGDQTHPPVIRDFNTPPDSPKAGERFGILESPTGEWVEHPNGIAEWDGARWVFTDPEEGMVVFNEEEDKAFRFKDGEWAEA